MAKKGTLENGFTYEVDENVLDDMRLVDAITEAEGENPLKVSKVMTMVLGDEQKERLYKSLENETGRVPVKVAMDALMEIFNSLGEAGKN